MSSTCACVYARDPRGAPPMAATLPQSAQAAGVIQHVTDRERRPVIGHLQAHVSSGPDRRATACLRAPAASPPAAVNCLETESRLRRSCPRRSGRRARDRPCRNPSQHRRAAGRYPAAQPGVDVSKFPNTASTFVSATGALLPRSAAGSNATQIARPKPCTMLKSCGPSRPWRV